MSDDNLNAPDELSTVDDVEYEYVYEDEDGNPIAAPSGDHDPSQFEEEVIEVIEQEEAGESESAAAGASPESRETRRVRSGSTRRLNGRRTGRRGNRQSGRQSSRELDPSQHPKYAKLKTILMVGSLALIPVLIIAIVLTYCYKRGYWPFRRNMTRTVVVQNDYELGRDMTTTAWRAFKHARQTLEGNDDRYFSVLQQCEQNYTRGIALMQGWRDKNPDPGYWKVDQRIQDSNIKLREVREQKFKIEMRRSLKK